MLLSPCFFPTGSFWASPPCDAVLWPYFTSQVTIALEHRLTQSKIYPGTECCCSPLPCLHFYAVSMESSWGCSAVCAAYGLSASSTVGLVCSKQLGFMKSWNGSHTVAGQRGASLGRALQGTISGCLLDSSGPAASLAVCLHFLQNLGRKLSVCLLPHPSHFYVLLFFFLNPLSLSL